MAMGSTSNVRIEVGAFRNWLGTFARVQYDSALVNEPKALLDTVLVDLDWGYGSLNSILIEEKDEAFVEQVLSLKKCELKAAPTASPR